MGLGGVGSPAHGPSSASLLSSPAAASSQVPGPFSRSSSLGNYHRQTQAEGWDNQDRDEPEDGQQRGFVLQGHPDESWPTILSPQILSTEKKITFSTQSQLNYPIPQNPIQIKYLNKKIDLKPRQAQSYTSSQCFLIIGHTHKSSPTR